MGCSLLDCLPRRLRAMGNRSVLISRCKVNTFSVIIMRGVSVGSIRGLRSRFDRMPRMGSML